MAQDGFVPMEVELGMKLLKLRGDLTQDYVSQCIGVRRETLKQWENIERHIKVADLVKIAEFYNVSADYLLGLKDTKILNIHFAQETLGLSDDAMQNILAMNTGDRRCISGLNDLLAHPCIHDLASSVKAVSDTTVKANRDIAKTHNMPKRLFNSWREILFGKVYVATKTFESILENMIDKELQKPIHTEQEADDGSED